MEHTYFYKTLSWKANGTYYDETEKEYPLYGEVSIIHDHIQWTLTGFLEVQYDTPVRFTNNYDIYSTRLENTLLWESYNPALGTLKGTFEIVGSSIISSYRSHDGKYSGTETLVQINSKKYYNAGVSFCDGVKMSSWTSQLETE